MSARRPTHHPVTFEEAIYFLGSPAMRSKAALFALTHHREMQYSMYLSQGSWVVKIEGELQDVPDIINL